MIFKRAKFLEQRNFLLGRLGSDDFGIKIPLLFRRLAFSTFFFSLFRSIHSVLIWIKHSTCKTMSMCACVWGEGGDSCVYSISFPGNSLH